MKFYHNLNGNFAWVLVLFIQHCYSEINVRNFGNEVNFFSNGTTDLNRREWCDPILGCLEITSKWYSISRPINVFPDPRLEINTRFYLHTREEPNENKDYEVSVDDMTNLRHSPFNAERPTKFIIHGYLDNGDTTWLKEMAAELLKHGNYNILRVNWGSKSRSIYQQAVADIRVVGLEVEHFVKSLMISLNLKPFQVHCIGHSLGAHACGYAGENINKMGRISGLDPAGPLFSGTLDFVHLDPTDAAFVDVIHTDADPLYKMGYGMTDPMGNLDFYVNSGRKQPGCDPISVVFDIFDNIFEEGREIFACSHSRAFQYYIESLSSKNCQWLAHECHDYKSFKEGQCYTCGEDDSRCAFLGIEAENYKYKNRLFAKFYIETANDSPFCMQHYQVTILTAYPKTAEKWVIGTLYLWLYGESGKVIKKIKITEKHQRIDHGQLRRSLFLSHQDVGQIHKVEIKWKYNDEMFNPDTYCVRPFCNRNLYVQTVSISPMNKSPEKERQRYAVEVCKANQEATEIKDGHKKSFTTRKDCVHI